MVYFFHWDNTASVRVEQVGGYDVCEGTKLPGEMPGSGFFFPRYRATIEFDFGNPCQMDGHGVAHGDYARDFAERVYQCLRESMPSETAFVEAAKAAGVYG